MTEVEQTGASSQFYDKFSSRRLMAFLFKFIWNNPAHREALNEVAKYLHFISNLLAHLIDHCNQERGQVCTVRKFDDQRRHLSYGRVVERHDPNSCNTNRDGGC
jgi:ubiquitin conjugation factor E4 B